MAPKTILLVDDNADFVQSNKEMLEALGYRVLTAYDGTQGIAAAREHHPDLIILDVMMAYETEGVAVARELRTIPESQNVKILMVSGIVSQKKLGRPLEPDAQWLPVERVLEKPIDPPKLIAEIENLIGAPE